MKKFSINRPSIAALSFLIATMLFSCKKELSSNNSNNTVVTAEQATTYSQESTTAEASFDDAEDVATTAADEECNASQFGFNGRFAPLFLELRAVIGDCATVTVTPNDSTYPKTITIDFGTGCLGRDGKYRSGAIIIDITAPLRKPGSVVTISFRDYFVNRVHLEGSKIISNLSDLPVHKWSVQVTGGKVTLPSGRGYSYESIKVKTQTAGMDTRIVRDDVYEITGRSQTEFNNGTTITLNTETVLVKKLSCPWISDGKLKIKINDRVLYLDYGYPSGGQCDNKALLTWNDGNNQLIINL